MTLRQKIFFRILLAVYLVVLAVLCLGKFSSTGSLPKALLGIPMDKIVHFCMFLPFPVLVYLALDHLTSRLWQSLLMTAGLFALGCGLAALTEYLQSLTTWRSADRMDFIADVVALAAGSVIIFIIDVLKQKK